MALSDGQIVDIAAAQQLYNRTLPAIRFARAIEAEVRKDYEELIRQMLDAMTAPVDGDALHALHMQAITAARARLEQS